MEIPYPPIRGNVIGIYHRIKALHESGVSIILHAFYKKLSFPEELTQYCTKVYLYRRKPLWHPVSLHHPLFVQSRRDPHLVETLMTDTSPIWFEGLHTLFHFEDNLLRDRKKYIRLHNMESSYYYHLADSSGSILKKLYYRWESSRSKWLEQKLLNQPHRLFAISQEETALLNRQGFNAFWLPPFHPHTELTGLPGTGEYALYHGDLSIKENEDAALFLIDHVFQNMDFPLVIAGHRPSRRLINRINAATHTRLSRSPSSEQMNQLIREAQLVLLPFTQTTGYKMKMIDSLAMGRHILTSAIMQVHTELEGLVYFAETPKHWIQRVNQLRATPFHISDRVKRQNLFETILNNKLNAEQIIDLIFPS